MREEMFIMAAGGSERRRHLGGIVTLHAENTRRVAGGRCGRKIPGGITTAQNR